MDLLLRLLPLVLVCALPHQTHAEELVPHNENCTYAWIFDHLGLKSNEELLTQSRPVKDPTKPLDVYVELYLQAILNLDEAAQTFTSHTAIELSWYNEHLQWDEQDNCPIDRITVSADSLWKPDLYIYEEVERENNPDSPFLVIKSGDPPSVHMRKDMVIMTTCKVDMYKFPFDTQSCNFTIRSFVHSKKEIDLVKLGSDETVTEQIMDFPRTEYKWTLQNVHIIETTRDALNENQKVTTYTIVMKRRSGRYVVNFISMALFFLALDYASFLLPEGDDKLGFKTTILLSITVLQLLLNEIVPSSADIPLIDIFCIGVFCLMMCSLLETIVVMYLKERDSRRKNHWTEKTTQEEGLKLLSLCNNPQKNFSDGLSEHTRNKQENKGPGAEGEDSEHQEGAYWSSRVYIINRGFLFVYTICTALFLGVIFHHWTT